MLEGRFYTFEEVAASREYETAYAMLIALSQMPNQMELPVDREQLGEIIRWCKQNAKGFCTMMMRPSNGKAAFFFNDNDDAMRFKLTWM